MTNPLRPRGPAWERVCAFYNIRPGYWFAPKLYGYGATPVRWQGWALLAIFAALAIGVVRLGVEDNRVLFALLAPLIVSFVMICHAKTDGEWKWRWGPDS